MITKPTVISLFAGTGGSSLGYQMAGFKELLAIDNNLHAVKCFKSNFPNVTVLDKNIEETSVDDILSIAKIKKEELDILDGSPPCQGFSTAGQFNPDDQRNLLFDEYIRLAKGLRPKIIVAENVPGMAKGAMMPHFNRIFSELEGAGYIVSCKKLNSLFYGVPQNRERLIIIGVREDLGYSPVFPDPDFIRANQLRLIDVLPNVDFYSTGMYGDALHPNTKAVCTITKTCSLKFYEGGIKRKPTINEIKLLSSFPSDFKMDGSFNEKWARIGNAVPPLLMKAIAESLKNKILDHIIIPNSEISNLHLIK